MAPSRDNDPRPVAFDDKPQAQKSRENSARLLVVDDNEMNRDMLSRRLARKGHDVAVASNGAEALELISAQAFDVVLLDIMMPGISGLEVLQRVRKTRSPTELPIIMATAKTESADIVEALRLGANDYVTKPLDFKVVLARVATQLGLKRATEEVLRLAGEVELRNQFIREVFGRYLSDDIVTRLLETPEGLALGGEKRVITILMCDIRGFSVLSAELEPGQLVQLVNNFLAVMTEVILNFGGTIDEFIGDAILVLFGAPVAHETHAEAAVACALRMQQAMTEVNNRNRRAGLPEVEMGIGINTGEVVVGNIGSEKRAKYGVVGTPVNLAARIEAHTVGGQVLIAEATRNLVSADLTISGEWQIEPKGADAPIRIFEVAGLANEVGLSANCASENLRKLPDPIIADCTVMDGKRPSGDAFKVTVTHISSSHALLNPTAEPLLQLTDVRLSVPASQADRGVDTLFAKVTAESDPGPVLRFTSVPAGFRSRIERLLA